MARRVAGLLRELELRTDQRDRLLAERDAAWAERAELGRAVSTLTSEVDRLRTLVDDLTAQCDRWQGRAGEYDALMATRSMRLLRGPRRLYALLLRRRRR